MKYPQFVVLLPLILFSSMMLVLALYLLAKYNGLFRSWIRNELLRQNLAVWLIGICFNFALLPTNGEFHRAINSGTVLKVVLMQMVYVLVMVLIVFNAAYVSWHSNYVKAMSFRKRMAIMLTIIILSTVLVGIPINYIGNGGSFANMDLTVLYNFYTGCITGLIFVTMSYVDLDRQRKMSEKDLEVSRLQELKTKAELEVLHSKINPHFLYNALNSIADLSITDGKKARKMTVALADLFRFSINYSNHNYSTVKDEVEMAEVYLQIEKIRFEDQLNYTIDVDDSLNHFLVPRFVLQPIVENAVKHGLKATGRMTHIGLEARQENGGFVMNVTDNGPAFPGELNPGYGMRSVFDKMDLLFPNVYEIHFSNEPRKQVSIHIKKLIKNEPVV